MQAPTKLLLVEDDPNLGNLLAEYLRAKGFDTELCTDGQQGWLAYKKGKFDLLILDVMMPVKDGFTLAREIRQNDAETPIMFLTAKSMKQDTIHGFQTGADDYLTKPFVMEELLLRIGAVLRRTNGVGPKAEEPEQYVIGASTFDPRKQVLRTPVGERKLTTKESELLRLLCAQCNDVLERSDALNAVWGNDSYFSGRSMDVYIAKLRKYLREDPGVEIINVHGRGFRLIAKEGVNKE
ncbi:MAG: response regulator transcription factor [Flavobacteriales bacterium]